MSKRSKKIYPMETLDLPNYIAKAWKEGWLDEYSDDHFLIKAIENRVNDIEWKTQLLFNNLTSMYTPLSKGGNIDFNLFSSNFVVNISSLLLSMDKTFGEDNIKRFIKDQLSAGKEKYDRDSFFQALSEIEILSFYCRRCRWSSAIYEPPLGINGSNPEACLEVAIPNANISDKKIVRVNIEVKTPKFPVIDKTQIRIAIPTLLLSDKGRKELKDLCVVNKTRCIFPRATKLVQFINSAAKKFNKPKENEFNLLYINWSYSDFPSNGFLEAWSLLVNEVNGILLHPEIGMNLPFKEAICSEAYEKISAVILYTSSLEQLMFSDFHYVWQSSEKVGPRFRMLVLDETLRKKELSNESDFLFKVTGMKPDLPKQEELEIMFAHNWTAQTPLESKAMDCKFELDAIDIIKRNPWKIN